MSNTSNLGSNIESIKAKLQHLHSNLLHYPQIHMNGKYFEEPEECSKARQCKSASRFFTREMISVASALAWTMQILVETFSGNSLTLHVNASDTIATVKANNHRSEGNSHLELV